MHRDFPTLADTMIAMALDKRLAGGPGSDNAEIRKHLLNVANARKFVLDDAMSRFIFDLESQLYPWGGIRKRFRALENARMLSRLPHSLIFIEFNYLAYAGRAKELGRLKFYGGRTEAMGPLPAKMGLIIGQHPKFENVFISSEVTASVTIEGRCLMHPVSIAWTTDNQPLPFETVSIYKDEEDQTYLVMMNGYRSKSVGWVLTYSDSLSTRLATAYGDARKPAMTARAIWGILSTINDLPVVIEHVEPSRGYMARGNYKKFLKHSVVHLTVPETRWRKLITKAAAIVRRRAHQVRGHWRNDWQRPLSVNCEHVFNSQMVCERCRGRKLWIHEHQRGDASLGFVIHDYEVSKKVFHNEGQHRVDS
jgi:hypothetical protein